MIWPQEFRRYPHFANVPDQKLDALASLSSIRRFKAGERLFEEGESATHLMIIKSGQVDIVYRLGDGREVAAESSISGDLIAWSAVLAPFRLTASAVGVKDGELIAIEGKQLRDLCESDLALGYQLMTEIARGLRDRLAGLQVELAAAR